MYAFCAMPKYPGYFWLCYKAGLYGPSGAWPIKVIPNAFELDKHMYPDILSLKNGFKMVFSAKHPGNPAGAARR
jgi:transcription elongation factor SPT6